MENEAKTPKIVNDKKLYTAISTTYWEGCEEFGDEKMVVISNLRELNKYLEQKIDALQENIDKLEEKTIRLEKTFKFSGFYIAVIYVVFLTIGHLAHWI